MLASLLKTLVPGFGRSREAPARPTPQPTAAIPNLRYERGGSVLAFVVPSKGDSLKQHTLEMLEPLRPLCKDIVVLDLNDPAGANAYMTAAQNPVWFVMSAFGEGEVCSVDGGAPHSPWAQSGIPFVRLFGDVPAYFPARHVQHFPNSINAYGHREHQDFFARWFAGRAPCLTLPLFPFDRVPKHAVDFERKASSGAIVFPKNGNCPDRLASYWRKSLPPAISRALESIAEALSAVLEQPVDLAAELQRYFAALSIDLPGNRRLMFFLVAQLDDYVRRKKSTLIARSVLDFPVTVRGINWEHIDFAGRRAKHDPDMDYGRTRQLLDDSLAIMDMSPNTQRGAHDRALRAAGRYTAFLTDRQRFFAGNFENYRDFTFRFDPDDIRECVEAALARPRDTVEMGVAQAERMRELLTEQHYVEQLVTVVDACALACGSRPPGTQDFVSYEPVPAA